MGEPMHVSGPDLWQCTLAPPMQRRRKENRPPAIPPLITTIHAYRRRHVVSVPAKTWDMNLDKIEEKAVLKTTNSSEDIYKEPSEEDTSSSVGSETDNSTSVSEEEQKTTPRKHVPLIPSAELCWSDLGAEEAMDFTQPLWQEV
eukprot:NODE_3236_length_798_cov_352.556742_g2701_i0.p1 GENE.NODE_3236_length_798_cov_352.556742_g2701_i0~~NODE_3236_length_798_cov_352.556742_g2701_i0.p1  ORF type:complete len:152 (+),score=22.42 NODE_3236_length_798_cov_352.556742_g2701_i0:27-458(+)